MRFQLLLQQTKQAVAIFFKDIFQKEKSMFMRIEGQFEEINSSYKILFNRFSETL